MFTHSVDYDSEVGWVFRVAAPENRREITEEPRTSQTTASHNDAVAAR